MDRPEIVRGSNSFLKKNYFKTLSEINHIYKDMKMGADP
jgi:hypothetical protein